MKTRTATTIAIGFIAAFTAAVSANADASELNTQEIQRQLSSNIQQGISEFVSHSQQELKKQIQVQLERFQTESDLPLANTKKDEAKTDSPVKYSARW
ncbi:hypothetical protein [Paraferrimonas haliotis]|uniref:Uncharacterized protein n=1 Tax=Paraferrimonas haliotis TaxID=2013866 RepID=A0AA37TL06_9GAMM|nr:hypothetical protein [Paraferrimonas haliotis]GLS82468.1 hypothetical protein GCM10007894_04450 [Paraferrimonas haliotis]